jgi:NarL family two-component system response regulator LiaR
LKSEQIDLQETRDVEPISVLIVDDHAVVRSGLRSFLRSEGDIEIVGEAGNGTEAIEKVQELLPEVVLMDLVMPGMDGIEATRTISRVSPASRVLVLTSFGEEDKVFPAIKAGARGYMLKDVPAKDLGRAIRGVARGEFLLHPDIAEKVLDELREPAAEPLPGELTPREVEVLTLVAQGLTNQEIAQRLIISVRTVKAHMSNILGKLHAADRTQAALYAMRQGLVSPE